MRIRALFSFTVVTYSYIQNYHCEKSVELDAFFMPNIPRTVGKLFVAIELARKSSISIQPHKIIRLINAVVQTDDATVR